MGFSQLPLCFRVKFGITECVPACHGVRLGFWHIFRLDVTVLWQEVVCLGQGPGKGADSLVIGGFPFHSPFQTHLSGKSKTIEILVIPGYLYSMTVEERLVFKVISICYASLPFKTYSLFI